MMPTISDSTEDRTPDGERRAPPRIAIVMHGRASCRLLCDWLADAHEVIVPDTCRLPEGAFDLCILDGPALEQLHAQVQRRKAEEAPTFLPVLFVARRDDLDLVTRFLHTAVDEVIVLPTARIELATRVESLLRSRGDALELARLKTDALAGLVDVSERMAAEAERARSLQCRLETLQRADMRKDQFLGILSHELRTPLTGILGFASVLADEIGGTLTPLQQGHVEKILHSAQVLLMLINELLDVSRIQAGKFGLTCEPMDPARVASEVIALLQALGRAKAITVTLEVVSPLPTIHGDPQRVAQVLTNLIGNAIKFTPPGGSVMVHLRRADGTVLCEVTDSGAGIAPEHHERLFQPFSQVGASNTRPAGGTGLGLSIAKALVDAHDGRIGVRSTPGAGSTFWFSLPIAAPDGTPPATRDDQARQE
jgi:signal transduction histidine kinase